jgi:mono/diheme cytochrome c family protein
MLSSRRLTLAVCLIFAAISWAADAPVMFVTQCASCHGADGHGKTANAAKLEIPDLRSKKVQDLTDDELYETIARGAKHRNYPHAYLYRGMKEKDIIGLVQYIRTLAPAATK